MRVRSTVTILITLLLLAIPLLPGCTAMMDLEYDEYIGSISVPNLGNRTAAISTFVITVWYNEGKVEGSGKVMLEDISRTAGATTFTDTYILKFSGTFDGKSGLLNGLVAVSGGLTCISTCAGTSNTTYNHSSYWQAQASSGKLVNGKISAYPDFKTSYFLFESSQVKKSN